MDALARIAGWESFKCRKSRAGTTVEFPVALLDSFAFASLPLEGKALAPLLLLLAAGAKGGAFPRDAEWLAFRLRLKADSVARGVAALAESGFIETVDSDAAPVASLPGLTDLFATAPACDGVPKPDKAVSEAALREQFEARFWPAYPRRQAKAAALKAFLRLAPDDALLDTMCATLRRQAASHNWQEEGGKFIPLPATWLNGRRREDEASAVAKGSEDNILFRLAQ